MSTVVEKLFLTIQDRKVNAPAGSYTARLFADGENEILKKIGEEAVEVIIATKGESDDRIVYEMADLIYHNLVLLAERDLSWKAVADELEKRMK